MRLILRLVIWHCEKNTAGYRDPIVSLLCTVVGRRQRFCVMHSPKISSVGLLASRSLTPCGRITDVNVVSD